MHEQQSPRLNTPDLVEGILEAPDRNNIYMRVEIQHDNRYYQTGKYSAKIT